MASRATVVRAAKGMGSRAMAAKATADSRATGANKAAAFRRFDRETGLWSIWWHDARSSLLDPPVKGRFEDGVGRFFAEDTLDGRPIRVRFVWSDITSDSARWEQAFSPDGGASWEVNWIMTFERAR